MSELILTLLPMVIFGFFFSLLYWRNRNRLSQPSTDLSDADLEKKWRQRISWDIVLIAGTVFVAAVSILEWRETFGVVDGLIAASWTGIALAIGASAWRQVRMGWQNAKTTNYVRRLYGPHSSHADRDTFGPNGAVR